MDIRERGIAAARAFLERLDLRVIDPGESGIDGADILAVDGDTLVGVMVQVGRSAEELPGNPTVETLAQLLPALERRQEELAPEASGTRVDLISLLVIAEDRALLRHHRAVGTDLES